MISSYTAASAFPAKLFCEDDTVASVRNHRIRPFHVQVNPTNRCPLACKFCSCANREKNVEIPYCLLTNITDRLVVLGAKAVTITGGGDPLAYDNLPKYIKYLHGKGIEVSLVTNGVLFGEFMTLGFMDYLSWCRISLSDERELRPNEIGMAINMRPDFSFSYVVTTGNLGNIIKAVEYANRNKFSHVRMVDDIIKGSKVSLDKIRQTLVEHGIDISRVIWQGRKEYTKGSPRCLVGLLKPNIDVYGNVTPCCGIQYASNPPALDFTRAFRVCDKDGIEKVYKEQRYFSGAICERCYYSDYNNALNAIWDANTLKHKNFI